MTNDITGYAMQGLGLLGIVLIAWLIVGAQRDKKNKIDMTYLLVEPSVGNVTLGKFGGLIALIASSWIMIYLTVSNHFDGVAFAAYLATWAAVKIMADVTAKPTPGVSAEVTTTTSSMTAVDVDDPSKRKK